MPQHHSSYGTQPFRRDNAPGAIPVELRRVRVPRSTGSRRSRRSVRRALVARSTVRDSQRSPLPPCAPRHARSIIRTGSSHGGVAVSNADGRGFDSFRACFHAPGNRSGPQHLDNCRGISGGRSPRRSAARVTPDWWGTGLLPRNRLGSRPRARTPVDVAEWRRHWTTNPEAAGSTPAVDTASPRTSSS